MNKKKDLKIKCPRCKESFNYYGSDFRPFCSDRCKTHDLAHWLTGSYAIKSEEPLSEEDMNKVIENYEETE